MAAVIVAQWLGGTSGAEVRKGRRKGGREGPKTGNDVLA